MAMMERSPQPRGTAPASLGVQGCMAFTEVNQASRPTRDMLLVRNLGPAGRRLQVGTCWRVRRVGAHVSQDTPEHAQRCELERPQSCRDHGLVSSLCSAVSSSLARHLPMARRIHAWHDLAVSWRLLQHLPCIVVVLLLVQLCAPQRRLGMRGRRDSGSVAGERRGTSAPSRHNVVVCAAVCLPPITSLRGSVLAAHHQPDTLPKSGCAGSEHAAAHCRPHRTKRRTWDTGHAGTHDRQAAPGGRTRSAP